MIRSVEPISVEAESAVGVVLIHGFTSDPGSVEPLTRALIEAGYNLEVPLLTGHGQSWSALNTVRYQDWLADAEAAYDRLARRCRIVFAAGQSMGGALCLHLAQTKPDLAGLILINHILLPPGGWKRQLLPLLRFLPWGASAVGGDINDPSAGERTYSKTSFNGAYQLVRLLDMIRPRLDRVTAPTLIMTSRQDHVVPPRTGAYTLDRITAEDKSQVWLEKSFHVAALDYDRELIARRSLSFIDRISDQILSRPEPTDPAD